MNSPLSGDRGFLLYLVGVVSLSAVTVSLVVGFGARYGLAEPPEGGGSRRGD